MHVTDWPREFGFGFGFCYIILWLICRHENRFKCSTIFLLYVWLSLSANMSEELIKRHKPQAQTNTHAAVSVANWSRIQLCTKYEVKGFERFFVGCRLLFAAFFNALFIKYVQSVFGDFHSCEPASRKLFNIWHFVFFSSYNWLRCGCYVSCDTVKKEPSIAFQMQLHSN